MLGLDGARASIRPAPRQQVFLPGAHFRLPVFQAPGKQVLRIADGWLAVEIDQFAGVVAQIIQFVQPLVFIVVDQFPSAGPNHAHMCHRVEFHIIHQVDGVAPEAGQSKPQLIDSRPVNEFYPPSAIARGETGSLVLRARVDREGCAKEFAVAVRSAVPALDAAALEWFETARYSPATRGGRAVDSEHTFKVKFVLDETPAG